MACACLVGAGIPAVAGICIFDGMKGKGRIIPKAKLTANEIINIVCKTRNGFGFAFHGQWEDVLVQLPLS